MGFFPRPAKPSVAWSDLRAFLRVRNKHKIGFAALAIFIPFVWLFLFYLDQEESVYKPPEIIWVQKIDPNRSIDQIKAEQKAERDNREALEAKQKAEMEKAREPFKKLDKAMDKWGL